MIAFGDSCNSNQSSPPFLLRSEETDDNFISFVIAFPERAPIAKDSTGNEKADAILADATLLCPGGEQYEILFEKYILYQVRNESYASWDKEEIAEGDFLRICRDSQLLKLLPLLTDCQILEDGTPYPGKWKHYSICCQNHVIDIITCREPVIQKSKRDAPF